MPERTVNPRDNVDLVLLLQSYGETLGTLFPQAVVYDNSDSEISGSPFTLSLVGNNLYTLSNAFQVADSGVYKIVYLVYTDAGHITRSASHGEVNDTINVKIQSTTGLGGYGSMKNGNDVIVDMDPILNAFKLMDKKFDKKIKKLQKDFDKGLSVDISKVDFSPILQNIAELKMSVLENSGSSGLKDMTNKNKKSLEKIISGIKKNRTTIIKNGFDKSILKPILQTVAESDLKTVKGLSQLKIDMVKTIDMKNEEANKKFNTTLNSGLDKFVESLNQLNDSIRNKLKFTLEGLRTLLFVGKQNKQNINITLKKNE